MESWSDSVDFRAALRQHGSPLYLFSPDQFRKNFTDYLAFVGEARNIAYPVKANPSLAILRRLANWGAGADCASAEEIELALIAGFPHANIVYNTPAFSLATANAVLDHGGLVVVNSESILDQLERANLRCDATQLLLRWNPGIVAPGEHKLKSMLSHGARTSQFGIRTEQLIERLSKTPLRIGGIHAHVGSRTRDLQTFADYFDQLHALVDEIGRRTSQCITRIDMGGGLAVDFNPQDQAPAINEFAARLAPGKRDGMIYMVEPGNALVGNCIGLLTQVVQMGKTQAGRYAIADVGSNELIKVTFPALPQQIIDARHQPLPASGPDIVAGPLCFAGDILLPATLLTGIELGDPLFIRHCGSYCYALSNHFNGRYSPPMAIVDAAGNIEHCNIAEPAWLDATRATYQWHVDFPRFSTPGEIRLYQYTTALPQWVEIVAGQQVSENTCEFSVRLLNAALTTADGVDLLTCLTQIALGHIYDVTAKIDYSNLAMSTDASYAGPGQAVHCSIAFSPWRQNSAMVSFFIGDALWGHGRVRY
jgi:diaminopimelate decarboxylase